MKQSHFYRRVAGRLSLATLVIAAAFAGVVWFRELERIDEAVVDLASAEAHLFVRQHGTALADPQRLKDTLAGFLSGREQGNDGHFVFVEVYDEAHHPLAEAALGNMEKVDAVFDRAVRPFPLSDLTHYDKVYLEGRLYLRVLTRVAVDDVTGYVEGIFEVAPQRLAAISKDVMKAVATVVAVVIGTALFLAPVFIGMNRSLLRVSERLLRANVEILEVLGGAIAKRDSDTGRHNYRVTLYAVHLAQELGRAPDEIRALIKGAFLHDVGKIGISDAILLKPGKLTEAEFAIMKTHVNHGVDIVSRSGWLDDAQPVVAGHHEKYDGSGYPTGASGEAIHLNARIFAVVDVFDALTSRRPYKKAFPLDDALAVLEQGRGSHFDPVVLDAFLRLAPTLYHAFADETEEALRAALLAVTERYV
ncbi:HD-GYP domain-containing protein [Pararhodospirillum oryzae]|uniref:HD-GYP domain-containing protein n=1 Tax=Pararhodospirillum oryzae TaxID=478448 RepID=A0A512H893_9PROT|nr:HD-GYP domain-containing protein [Pararhodospirillum oryzae]GEO81679.1 hypothetical protein ROR02_18100 [Pararhodospirillum oryzae]